MEHFTQVIPKDKILHTKFKGGINMQKKEKGLMQKIENQNLLSKEENQNLKAKINTQTLNTPVPSVKTKVFSRYNWEKDQYQQRQKKLETPFETEKSLYRNAFQTLCVEVFKNLKQGECDYCFTREQLETILALTTKHNVPTNYRECDGYFELIPVQTKVKKYKPRMDSL